MKSRVGKTQSMRSVGSTRSVKSLMDCFEREKTLDFDQMITSACNRFQISRRAVVKKDFRIDEYLNSIRTTGPIRLRRNTVARPLITTIEQSEKNTEADGSTKSVSAIDENTIVITAVYDEMNQLSEILLLGQRRVPRQIFQILGLIAPAYRKLTKLTVKRCSINAYAIYEMSNFLPVTTITDVCLDDTPCLQCNYVMLLNKPCRLVSLSLCRCNIRDETCTEIASKLHYMESAEPTLAALNLSSNHITDVGAKSLGEALRTNRHLRYLNLSGNRIADDGADHILHALKDFKMTNDEIMAKRRRYTSYLKSRQAAYLKFYSDWDSKSMDETSSVRNKKTQSRKLVKPKKEGVKSFLDADEVMHMRAEMMARDFVGPFIDPFNSYSTKSVDGVMSCLGNMVLCYLDLSYNNLSYLTIKRLNSVLNYQNINKKLGQVGLLKLCIDGNPLPTIIPELQSVETFLLKTVLSFTPRFMTDRRKSKGRISIPVNTPVKK